MPTISVIIPIYNVEQYLRQCIESVLKQSFADFELLLVDDGSSDASGAICDEYAAQDSRIRVFHKTNGGVSSARNVGLDNALGAWVTFIDADDYVTESHLSDLYANNDADLTVTGVSYTSSDAVYTPPDTFIKIAESLSFLDDQLCCIYMMTPWAKLLNNKIIQNQCLRFDSGLVIGEDTVFMMSYLSNIDAIRFIPQNSYRYNDSTYLASLIKYMLPSKQFKVHITAITDAIGKIQQRFSYKFPISSKLFNQYYSRLFFMYLLHLVQCHLYTQYIAEINYYKKNVKIFYANSYKKKFVMWIMLMFPTLAYRCIYLFRYK